MKVDKSKKIHEARELDWYECPYCKSYDIEDSSNFCPTCGEVVQWDNKESQ